ncbi:MAG: hypothetical protein P8Y99_11210 [Calditrichaceae bacterium]
MKFSKYKVLIFLILVFSCSSSTDSDDAFDFNNMNIDFYKSGGWINFYTLKIDSTGYTKAYVGDYLSSLAYLDSNATNLTADEKHLLQVLFNPFADFKKLYEPEHYLTDQNYYTIILKNKTAIDTTSVYDPAHCNLSDDLSQIMNFMENKIDELLPKY